MASGPAVFSAQRSQQSRAVPSGPLSLVSWLVRGQGCPCSRNAVWTLGHLSPAHQPHPGLAAVG